jgi:hypothetical protein
MNPEVCLRINPWIRVATGLRACGGFSHDTNRRARRPVTTAWAISKTLLRWVYRLIVGIDGSGSLLVAGWARLKMQFLTKVATKGAKEGRCFLRLCDLGEFGVKNSGPSILRIPIQKARPEDALHLDSNDPSATSRLLSLRTGDD